MFSAGSTGSWRVARQSLSVLFIDPDVQYAGVIAQGLPASTDVRLVHTAQAAMEAIQARMPDLVVTELNLPDASGVDLIAHLHRTRQTHNILLLVLTTRASVRDKIAAFQAGADDYLIKPSNPQEVGVHAHLLSRFQRVIGRS
jgi:DNA-binding response OmpR family regulator